VPDFKTVLRFDDLFNKPANLNLEKKVRYQAPLYYIRKQIVKSGSYTEAAVKNYMKELFDIKRQQNLGGLHENQLELSAIAENEQEALEKHQLRIQKIDKAIAKLDAQFNFNVEYVSIEMTGNKSDYYGNSKLMSFGCEKQGFSIIKHNKAIKINMFGLTLGSYNRFEEVYKFIMRTKNTMLKV
jgi:hypothetical protein